MIGEPLSGFFLESSLERNEKISRPEGTSVVHLSGLNCMIGDLNLN